jgi:hypothetical protein
MKDAETDDETLSAWAAREPQRGFIECADKLQDRGHSIDTLADAMMTIALTMQSKLYGPAPSQPVCSPWRISSPTRPTSSNERPAMRPAIDQVDGISSVFHLPLSPIRKAGHQRDTGAGLTAHLAATARSPPPARWANAMVKGAGLTWDEVLAPAGPIPPPALPPTAPLAKAGSRQ